MTEKYCMVCGNYFDGNTETLEINDGKDKVQITGHFLCVDTLYDKIKSLKNYQDKDVKRILKEIKFKLDN